MAALQCEICGGELMGRPGGIFECDSCGMKYDTAWARAKIQEVRGTVKVEGTVEVQGTVKIDGPIKVEGGDTSDSLIRQGYMELEDYEYEAALKYFKRAIARTPQSPEAYVGALLADYDCLNYLELEQKWTENMANNGYFKKALKYADTNLKQKLQILSEKSARLKAEREAEEARIAAENARRLQEKEAQEAADLAQRQADIEVLAQQRAVILPAQNRILSIRYSESGGWEYSNMAYWCPNGNIQYASDYNIEPAENVTEILADAKKVLSSKDYWFVLRYDGTLSAYRWMETSTRDSDGKSKKYGKLVPITTMSGAQRRFDMSGVIDFDVYTAEESLKKEGLVILCVFQKDHLTIRYGKQPVVGFNEKKIQVNWPASATIHCMSRYRYSEKDSIPCRCLCQDGTVLDVEGNVRLQNIASIYGDVMISKDGCVLYRRQCSEWRQIVAAASIQDDFTVGVRLDGSVVAADRTGPVLQEKLSEWKNIAAVYVVNQGFPHTVYAITKDGKLLHIYRKEPVAVNLFSNMDEVNRLYRICQSSGGWKKIRIMEETQKQITRIQQDIADKQRELDGLTGFFTKGKRARLSEELEILRKEHMHLEEKYKKLQAETGSHIL